MFIITITVSDTLSQEQHEALFPQQVQWSTIISRRAPLSSWGRTQTAKGRGSL